MTSTSEQITAEKLALMPNNGKRCELVDGVLHMMSPAGGRHGRIAAKLLLRVGSHVEQRRLGETFAAETGFLLRRNPDTVRAPDVAFVRQERATRIDDDTGFVTVVPDLVGEVVSPRDSFSEVEGKVFSWLAAGTRLVIVVDPMTRTVHDYRQADRAVVLREGESLDASDVLPGLTLDVADLFQ